MSNGNDMAFPIPHWTHPNGEFQWGESGLSKREMFAAMAMQGLCANSIPGGHHTPERLADEAVRKADALLAALAKSN